MGRVKIEFRVFYLLMEIFAVRQLQSFSLTIFTIYARRPVYTVKQYCGNTIHGVVAVIHGHGGN